MLSAHSRIHSGMADEMMDGGGAIFSSAAAGGLVTIVLVCLRQTVLWMLPGMAGDFCPGRFRLLPLSAAAGD